MERRRLKSPFLSNFWRLGTKLKDLLHGRPQGGEGALAPLEFEKKNDVICCRPTKYPKFSLAPVALSIDTIYFNLKLRKKKNAKLSFALSARRQMVIFYGAAKTCQFFKCGWFCPL